MMEVLQGSFHTWRLQLSRLLIFIRQALNEEALMRSCRAPCDFIRSCIFTADALTDRGSLYITSPIQSF